MTAGHERGVVLAVDVGKVRVGIARCDQARVLALPEATLARDEHTIDRIADLAREYGATTIIVGYPLTLQGESGIAAIQAQEFAEHLASIADCEVRLLDERLTTRQAHRGMQAAGRSQRRSRAVIDQAAAVILLNHALDSERATGTPAGRRVNVEVRETGPPPAQDTAAGARAEGADSDGGR